MKSLLKSEQDHHIESFIPTLGFCRADFSLWSVNTEPQILTIV